MVTLQTDIDFVSFDFVLIECGFAFFDELQYLECIINPAKELSELSPFFNFRTVFNIELIKRHKIKGMLSVAAL